MCFFIPYSRFSKDQTLLAFLYFPFGIFLFLIRIFFGIIIWQASALLPELSPLRNFLVSLTSFTLGESIICNVLFNTIIVTKICIKLNNYKIYQLTFEIFIHNSLLYFIFGLFRNCCKTKWSERWKSQITCIKLSIYIRSVRITFNQWMHKCKLLVYQVYQHWKVKSS